MRQAVAAALALTALACAGAAAADQAPDPEARAAATVKAMTPAERLQLLHGVMAIPLLGPVPEAAIPGAGYIPGVARLGVPNLTETDASLGVAYVGGLRKDGATALPSGMALGSTWDPEIMRAGGAMIGLEAKSKGFNVLLAGGSNLIREPRGGRTFEYLSEDPLLTGILVGAAIQGVQSNNIVSTIKHFALNGQETARKAADARISDAAERESDLLAFEIGVERGRPGSVMCAYNLVNGAPACASDYLLNQVLRRDWRYRGWVMSDWGATVGVEAALAGLDQESGEQIDRKVYFDKPLAEAAAADPKIAARVDQMAERIVAGLYAVGADRSPAQKRPVDWAADARVAQRAAEAGVVLLRNEGGALPLAAGARRIVVIGGYADTGVLSGGGSSQVQGEGGPAVNIPLGGVGPFAAILAEAYQRSVPLSAIRRRAGAQSIVFRTGRYVGEAVDAARSADVVIIFATQWMTEGLDVPDLSLPRGQDALIDAVASVNPRTVVVLETGGPVVMPWIGKTAAVLEAWYPGARGAEAVAGVLFGDVNPSGRLPVTFPASVAQLPRPRLDGADLEPNFSGDTGGRIVPINYEVEGSDVGYRWYARTKAKPLFPFGFGLSYTRFETRALSLSSRGGAVTASVEVANVGARDGADVVQLYLVGRPGRPAVRLAAFERVALKSGESRKLALTVDPRILADWGGKDWVVASGDYQFAVGSDAQTFGEPATVRLAARRLAP